MARRQKIKEVEILRDADLIQILNRETIPLYIRARVLKNFADKTYVYEQSTGATSWIINHGLDKVPAVLVINSSGFAIEPDIRVVSDNVIEIIFGDTFTGFAYLN
jgi:hypothetical protein